LATILVVVLTILSLGLGVYPDPLFQVAQRLLAAYPLPPL
jgi:NADH:ubiquinone oxidoreductase subunit 4 (subunit M)